MEKIIIPSSLQITMDDVGWFNGEDDRQNGGSAHTAMPRRHSHEDYAAINELGRRLNMRINCAFILGEWDPDNRLGKIKWLSKYGDAWDNAAYIDRAEMAAVADTINASPYIDIAVHGLMHNYYKPDIPYCNSDYFYRLNGKLYKIPDSEIRQRFDAFFDILDYYKINKTPNSFIPPTFNYIWGSMTDILADYGIRYVSTPYEIPLLEMPSGMEMPRRVGVEADSIITLNRNYNDIPWYEVSTMLDKMPPIDGIFGCHWPNALHVDKARHGEVIDGWVEYFERCKRTYGIILSRDIGFAATQTLFCEYAKVSYDGGAMRVDISSVPNAIGKGEKFYISSREEIKAFTGCDIKKYEQLPEFINYEVTPHSNVMTFA